MSARLSVRRGALFSWPAALAVLLAGFLAAGCSDEESAPDAGAADGAADLGPEEPTTGPDLADDVVEDADPRLCTPGANRCIADDAAQVCDDEGSWQDDPCEGDEICWGGLCGAEGTCQPLAVTACLSYTRYEGCNPVGTYEGEFEVPPTHTCVERDGVDQLVERVCLEGQTRCENEQVLQRCAESGLEYEFATNCFEQDETTLCDEGRCITLCQYIEKLDTYVGCEYWAVDLDNAFVTGGAGIYYDAFHSQFAVAVSNPGETLAADVTVEAFEGVLEEHTVAPGEMVVFQLPPAEIEGTMHGYWGYRITSTVPIVAYQFNPLTNERVFSNDASLLFPTSSLGTEYYVMTRRQTFEELKGSVTVVATQEGSTDVTIRFPERTPLNPLVTLAGTDIEPMEGGDELTWTLQQFEVLNIETNRPGADFTGTYVESQRPVAVWGGTEASNAPNTDSCIFRERPDLQDWVCEYDRETPCWDDQRGEPSIELCSAFITCCADHLEQQMLPIFAWGQEYNAARSAERGDEADVWRILSGADDVDIELIGIPAEPGEPLRTDYTLDEGEWLEFESRADFEIVADGPIFVGQFLAAELAPGPESVPNPSEFPVDAGTGDPAFIMAVPREQYRDDYIFLVPAEYAHNWVTIVAPVGVGVEHIDETQTEVLEADRFEPFGTGDWAVYRYELVNEGYHRMRAEAPFGVIVHGYDQYVSYGFPAGLDVKEINPRGAEE